MGPGLIFPKYLKIEMLQLNFFYNINFNAIVLCFFKLNSEFENICYYFVRLLCKGPERSTSLHTKVTDKRKDRLIESHTIEGLTDDQF